MQQKKQETTLNSFGFDRIAKKIQDNVNDSLKQLTGNIEAIQQEQQQINNNQKEQQKGQQQSRQQLERLQITEEKEQQQKHDNKQQEYSNDEIENIRRKQLQLMEQLKLLKAQEQRLLAKKRSSQQLQPQPQPQKQGQQEQQQIQQPQQPTQNINGRPSTLSPVKLRRYNWQKPRPKLPDPIVPEMSRQEFEERVKQIANSIKSKVCKSRTVKQSPKTGANMMKSRDQKYKQKYQFLQLPELQSTKNRKNKNSVINSVVFDGQQPINVTEISPQETPKPKQTQAELISRWIFEQIYKKSLQKIRYKQKYGIKLDPIHHKYPMTTFRKKVIQQMHQNERKKSMSESLRQSALHQRKQIFQKSRYK